MKTLIQINSSIFADGGQSTQLANRFVAAWRQVNPGGKVIVRDLARSPVPHLDAARFSAFAAEPGKRAPEQQAVAAFSDGLIDELKLADVIALGLPMYNFGVPSTLKAYFDHVARAGVSFRYTDKGSVGLLTGKKAYIFATRGGRYAGTPGDTQSGYVKEFLRFLGITDVQFVYAEGLAVSKESKEASLVQARAEVDRLLAPSIPLAA